MSGKLRVLRGKDPRARYDLVEKEIFLGRDPKCNIVIEDDAVSRRHARLLLENDTYAVEDLGSRNGTYVNGRRIDGKVSLKDNDRIAISAATFEYRELKPVAYDAGTGSTTNVLCSIDAVGDESAVVKANAESKLRAILQISKSLGTTLSLRSLLSKMLGGLFEIFPQADRGLVLLRDGNRLLPTAAQDRSGQQESVQYSKTIVSKAVAERKAILSQDAARDERIPVTASITQLQIRSVMCVPLLSQDGKVLGVIQLDTQDKARKFDTDDMETLTSVASQASVSIEHAQLHRAMMRHARMQRELDFAREVQHNFLPRSMPELEGYCFWVYYQAARQVGGDFYDFLRLPNGKEAVLLGDVAGKGIPAALMMAKVSSLCKLALLSYPDDLSEAMRFLNREVYDAGTERSFVTLVLCVIDPASHDLAIAVAGHMTPMLRRADSTIDDSVGYGVRGKPLGIERELQYMTESTRLAPGELAFLFSDGVSDAMNSREEPYSSEQIRRQLLGAGAMGPAEIGELLLADVRRHMADSEQGDDMSLVIFQRQPA